MKTDIKKPSIKDAKAAISKKTADFEARLLKAKNNFEIWCILSEMSSMCEAEIDHWLKELEGDTFPGDPITSPLLTEASIHIAELQSFIDKIHTMQNGLRAEALTIQRVLLREGKIEHPVILDTLP